MKPGSTPKRKKWTSHRIALSLFLLFALGGFVLWRVAVITDRNMRSELLQQARIAAHAISIDDVAFWSASEADLEKPSYHRIKSRLALMRRARHHCRFMYLMGRRADGTVFFFVDSLGPDDKDYAPPGLTYSEVSEDYLRVFESRQEAVVGPVTDRWGTLVTALIPLRSSASGNLRAVFGMDVDAGDWRQEIVRRCIGPLVATLLFAVLIFLTASREKTLRALRESEEKQAADITKLQQAEKALTRRSAFERLVGEISAEFVRLGPEEVDGGIERALAAVGAFAGTDRAYVFLYRTDGVLADNTHEWCARGIEPQMEHLQGISVGADLPWFETVMMKGKVFVVPDVATLPPEAQAERVHFEAQGIQSLIVVPMAVKDRLLGFMGFDAVRERIWEKTDQDVLELVGQAFTHALQRRRTALQLRESEDRWRFALEGAGDGVWDWDAVADKVFFSTQWKAMLGYAEEEIGDSLDEWDRRLHPADKAAVYAALEAHLRGDAPVYEKEHRLRCKDGSYKWILDRGKVIAWTPDGKPKRVIGTHTDISARKTQEAENERLILELTDALAKVKTLKGLLPICSFCKKIRDDQGYWNQLEAYIETHSDAAFSHGICRECAEKYYPDMKLFEEGNQDRGIATSGEMNLPQAKKQQEP